ncbi:MAG: DNA primase small subunit domain-containing protein [archaeon]|nr:DNA primase small subunit domain-containing protein [archaeon]
MIFMLPQEFLQQKFREYYSKSEISSIENVHEREFGIGEFGKKISQRHLAFRTQAEFNSFLKNFSPFFVSYSLAFYQFPERKPMTAKNLLKADIVYEFDSDDIKTECKKEHDAWKCDSCGTSGKGSIQNCTNCGSSVKVEQWVCEECLDAVKKQVFRLLNFLEKDFGLSEGISLNFSGNKGFHVHVRNEAFRKISHKARIELLDYLTSSQINPKFLGFETEGKRIIAPKYSEAMGWAKKLLDSLIELFESNNSERLAVNANISAREAEKILLKKQEIIDDMKKGILLQFFPAFTKSEKFWNDLMTGIIKEESLRIDRQTSVDLFKIIRVPETIHGSTGLVAKTLSASELKKYNAFNECVAFSNTPIKVHVLNVPKFELKKQKFGPYNNEIIEVPEFAGIFLLASGKADQII